MTPLQKIAAVVAIVGGIVAAIFHFDGRWVLCRVYAGDMAQMQSRQLQHELRQTRGGIDDLQDKIASKTIPESRKIVYRERLKRKVLDLKEIEEEKALVKSKGGVK